MNDEIKEILDRAKKLKYKCDCCEEIAPGKYIMKDDKQTDNLIEAVYIIDKLLDYITNLQQENETLHENNQNMQEEMARVWEENERLKEENVYCNRTDCVGRIKDSKKYDSVYQEKEDYKSRCEKASDNLKRNYWINEHEHNDDVVNLSINILQNGSETNDKN